jgi:hypothetical protein
MQTKEGWSVVLKIIATHNLGNSVRPITKWLKLPMGPGEILILQMKPDFVANLKLVLYHVFIMALLVLSIGFMQNLLDLLADVLNLLNESGGFFDHGLIKRIGFLCGGKRNCNINGSQGLESQIHLKWAMVGGTMESSVVIVLNIWETLVPCMRMLRFLHAQDVHNNMIDDLGLAIGLGVERSGFCELGVQQRLET